MKTTPEENYCIKAGTTLKEDLWVGPSLAVSCAVLVMENNVPYFLMETRGSGVPDFRGFKCMSCGFYDFKDKRVRVGAVRELLEETGLEVKPGDIKFAGISDGPETNRGHITLRYLAIVEGTREDVLSKINNDSESRGGESGESETIEFLSYEEIMKNPDKICFHHDDFAKIIMENLEQIKTGHFYWDSLCQI